MLQVDGGFDFSCPRDMQKLRMLLNEACQTHVPNSWVMWLLTCWYSIHRADSHYFLYCIIRPRNPARLNPRSVLHPCLFICGKIYKWRTTRGWDVTCCGPRFQVGFRIWPATRFEFHRPVSNCHCRVLCFEGKLICRLLLPTPFFTSEPSFFPYFAIELWDPGQWQSHVCRSVYVHRIRMCFMWNVQCQDTPTVKHCECKEQFSFVKLNFTSSNRIRFSCVTWGEFVSILRVL
jgi:hypothetical protein